MTTNEIMSMYPGELEEYVAALGEKPYRARQLFADMAKGYRIGEMSDLPLAFRSLLISQADYRLPEIADKRVSKIDGTVKYLFRMTDGECVESVFMRYEHGTSLCVSSQAGCAMGCRFCASTLLGKARDLTASEIYGQAVMAGRDTGERVDNIVLMGTGEPLDNFDNVVRFIRLISDSLGLGLGVRHISLSTCGLVPGIYRLAETGLPVTLSVSLHASDDATRDALMPVNRAYNIEKLLTACRDFFRKTGRRVTFEYTLISGKNDSEKDALKLADLLRKGMTDDGRVSPCHVNLIRLNEVEETGLEAPSPDRAKAFVGTLRKAGINATVRRRLGADVTASCGQLRLRHIKEENKQQQLL